MPSAIAIITARGGSKRIPGKNIRPFHGKPIITYSIEAALAAGCFKEVMVSTDDDKIAAIAKECGATVPFSRSAETSNDSASTVSVLQEVIAEYEKQGSHFDLACCLYPTAPFVTASSLRQGYDALSSKADADAAFTLVRFSYPIQRAFRINKEEAAMMWPENMFRHSQELEAAYHDAGQFYWLRVKSFLESGRIFAERSVPIVLPESEVQDIDNEEDWKIAELKFALWRKQLPQN
ncbi:MAG: pseudaminic acid cytidylyltransferase [Chthoniobacterales bacterium]